MCNIIDVRFVQLASDNLCKEKTVYKRPYIWQKSVRWKFLWKKLYHHSESANYTHSQIMIGACIQNVCCAWQRNDITTYANARMVMWWWYNILTPSAHAGCRRRSHLHQNMAYIQIIYARMWLTAPTISPSKISSERLSCSSHFVCRNECVFTFAREPHERKQCRKIQRFISFRTICDSANIIHAIIIVPLCIPQQQQRQQSVGACVCRAEDVHVYDVIVRNKDTRHRDWFPFTKTARMLLRRLSAALHAIPRILHSHALLRASVTRVSPVLSCRRMLPHGV